MAADTFTALLGFLKQGTGNNNNTWGALLNSGDFDEVDLAIAGRNAITTTGGTTDLSASPPPAGPSGAIHAILDVSGVLASNAIIKVPNLSKIWIIRNGTTGAFTLTVETPSGSPSVALPQGGWSMVWCDGNNTIYTGISTTNRDVQWLAPDGTLAAPGIAFGLEPGTGIRRKGTNDIVVTIGGVDVFELTGAGAGTPNVANFLSPMALQIAGTAIRLPGEEVDYDGLTEPTGWYFTAGQAKSRTTDATLFAVIAPNTIGGTAITGNTHTNTTLDGLSVDLRGLGLVGATIEGTGIPTGTTVSSINSGTALTLSQAATGTATGIAIRVLPYGQGDGSTTFNLPDRRGTFTAIRDDLGGTPKGNLTKATTQGIDGTRLNATGGEQTHTQTVPEIATHTPTTTGPHHHGGVVTGLAAGAQLAQAGASTVIVLGNTGDTDITLNPIGSSTAFNEIPPASICNRLIKR